METETAQLRELKRWRNLTLGRESRIQELKAEVNELLTRHGESPRYSIDEETDPQRAYEGQHEVPPIPAAVHTDIPNDIVNKWQRLVNLIAEALEVPAALIMRVAPPEIAVCVSSQSRGNPYELGEKAPLDTGLYCETVMATRRHLLVPNALTDEDWRTNPDVKLGMISYLGFPVVWPNGQTFGTICILDNKENAYNELAQRLLREFRDVVQADLAHVFHLDTKLTEMTKARLADSERASRAMLSMLEDQKRTEEALRESEEKVRLLLESTAEALYGLDVDGRCTLCNPACLHLLGYDSADRLIGKDMHEVIHHSRPNVTSPYHNGCAIQQATRRGEGAHADDEYFRRSDGTIFPVEYWSHPIRRNGEIIGTVVAFLDITERKQAEKALQESQNDLLNQQRREKQLVEAKLATARDELVKQSHLAALGQLTASVAHEIRNPLGTIRSSVFTIERSLSDVSPRVTACFDRLRRNIARCDSIVEELLDYLRARALYTTPTELDAFVEGISGELEIPDGIEVRCNLTSGCTLPVDQARLQRCLTNVVDNACSAMTTEQGVQGQLIIETRVAEDRAEIHVIDTGAGIDQNVLQQVFEPLYSTKTFGVGLGLPIVKKIMERHQGGIEIESRKGEGTKVTMWLPIG